jgi:CheY-like chemotaxis protein
VPCNVSAVHVLLATDADWVVDEVVAALGGPDTSFTVCRDGHSVTGIVEDRTPDLVVLDLQIGTMGAIAVTMALRLDESAGLLPHVNVLVLLDRRADVHLARRSGADGWLVKPLDALRLRRAGETVASGRSYHNGVIGAAATSDTATGTGSETAEHVVGDDAENTVADGSETPFAPDAEPASAG